MALPKQMVPYPLTKGQDLGVDKLLVSGLLQADDVVFDASNTAQQRGGLVQGYSGAPSAFLRAFTVNGFPAGETVDGRMLPASLTAAPYGYKSLAAGAGYPSYFQRCAASSRRVQSIQNGAQHFDAAVSGSGDYCLAWNEPDPTGTYKTGVRFSIRDSNHNLKYELALVSTQYIYDQPRVLVNSVGNFVFLYTKQDPVATPLTSQVAARVYTPSGSAVIGETLFITIGASFVYDAAMCADGAVFAIAGTNTTPNVVSQQVFSNTLVVRYSHPATVPAFTPYPLSVFISVSAGSYTTQYAYSGVPPTNTLLGRYITDGGAASAEITIYTAAAGTGIGRIAIGDYGAGVTVVCDNFAFVTAAQCKTVIIATTANWVVAGSIVLVTGAVIASTIASRSSRGYILLASEYYASTGYNTARAVLAIDLTEIRAAAPFGTYTTYQPHAVARLDQYAAQRYVAANQQKIRLPNACSAVRPQFFYRKYETDLLIAGQTNDTGTAIAYADLDFTSQLGYVEQNGLTILAGGCPLDVDGFNVVEDGFHWPPDIIGTSWGAGPAVLPAVNSSTATFGPFPASKTFTIALTEAWVDSAGNWHESRPSVFVNVTSGAGNLYLTVALSRPPSLKDPSKRRLLLYRTLGDSTDNNMYLSQTAAGTFYDDTYLAKGEVLYTGTRLAQDGAPACRHLAISRNRLVATGCDDPFLLWHSISIDRGYGVSWNLTTLNQRTVLPVRSGRGVGCAEMDGKLVVVCEEQVGYILGNGPDTAGVGEFSDFETVVADQGADWNSPRSIGQGGDGVWFYTARGLRCLGRNNELLRDDEGGLLGVKLDSLLVSAVGVTYVQNSANQLVRFFNNGYCYVYDTQWKQWTRFTNHAAADAVYAPWLDQFWHFNSTFGYYYSETTYLDPGSTPINCYAQLPHIQVGGIQGFQRVQKMLTIFDSVPDVVNVSCAYDFGALASEMSAAPAAQFRHDFVTQKCQALSVQLNWTSTSKRPRLSAVSLQVAVKPGPFRIGSGGTY